MGPLGAALSDVRAFYDGLAPLYHLVYENWDASVDRQGAILAALIEERWGPRARVVLDAAVGIGTQALGLLSRGFTVTGSDLSPVAARRAMAEAAQRGFTLPCVAADFRALAARSAGADVVIVCDNALPHLQTEAEIRTALGECFRCARPAGGCVISMRDYGVPPAPGTAQVHPYGEREWQGRRYHLRQVWTWRGAGYDMALEIAPRESAGDATVVLRTSYLAIPPARVAALMTAVGFEDVRRIDGQFVLPLLVGTRPR